MSLGSLPNSGLLEFLIQNINIIWHSKKSYTPYLGLTLKEKLIQCVNKRNTGYQNRIVTDIWYKPERMNCIENFQETNIFIEKTKFSLPTLCSAGLYTRLSETQQRWASFGPKQHS